jgi:hypothetical protein
MRWRRWTHRHRSQNYELWEDPAISWSGPGKVGSARQALNALTCVDAWGHRQEYLTVAIGAVSEYKEVWYVGNIEQPAD